MGSSIGSPDLNRDPDTGDSEHTTLGELLSGRLADVDVDSVEVVREERERQ